MQRGLGFTVEMIGEVVAQPAETKEWTAEEVSPIVAEHFVFAHRSDDTNGTSLITSSYSLSL